MPIKDFFATGIGMAVLIILIIQVILWFLVPFFIFAINKRLKVFLNYYLEKDGKKLGAWDGEIKPIKKAA